MRQDPKRGPVSCLSPLCSRWAGHRAWRNLLFPGKHTLLGIPSLVGHRQHSLSFLVASLVSQGRISKQKAITALQGSRDRALALVWDVTRNGSMFPSKGCPDPEPSFPHPSSPHPSSPHPSSPHPSSPHPSAGSEQGHHFSPQQWILSAAKCLFCQHVPNPQPKADENTMGGKDGNELPFETQPQW